MSTLNFNANEVEPSIGFDAIPAGKYQAVITDSEMKDTKSGTGKYLQLEFEIIEGDYKNRKLWARLNLENANSEAVRMARADLSAICRSRSRSAAARIRTTKSSMRFAAMLRKRHSPGRRRRLRLRSLRTPLPRGREANDGGI